jgi:hypothetical protein
MSCVHTNIISRQRKLIQAQKNPSYSAAYTILIVIASCKAKRKTCIAAASG